MPRDKDISQFDFGLVLRDVHDRDGKFLRVNDSRSVVGSYYSHFTVEYNVDNQPSLVRYWIGMLPHLSVVMAEGDVGGSLNNAYFTLRSNPDNQKYHVWFNVSGAGVDPMPLNSIGIEVPIQTNDPAGVVAYAMEYVLNNVYSGLFVANRKGDSVEIRTRQLGVVDDTVDFNTGFVIDNTAGEQRLVKQLELEYQGGDPVYQGQTLKGYFYDIYSGKFQKNPELDVELDDQTSSVSAAIGGHSTRKTVLVVDDYLAADLSTAAFTEVVAHTVVEAMKVKVIKVNTNTFGSFRVKVNGDIRDYYQTSVTERNCRFEFSEDLLVDQDDVLTIEFIPDRIQLAAYNFFMRVEAYT